MSETKPDIIDFANKSDLELNQIVKDLISEYGDEAADEAISRMKALMDTGDVKSAQFWLSVSYEINKLGESAKSVN